MNFRMKTLYVIRHAKSSWENEDLSDFERPLNERGKRDAPRMGKRLKEKGIIPDLMLSSPAKRAYSTAKRIAEALSYSKDRIKTDQRLYHADEEEIFNCLTSIKDKHDVVLLFGHNPGLTDFVNAMAEEDNYIDNVPTCGIVCLSLPIESWKELAFGKAKFVFFDYPKSKED